LSQSSQAAAPDHPQLKRALGAWDLTFLSVVAIANLNLVPVIAASGPIVVWLWLAALVFFLLPQGVTALELAAPSFFPAVFSTHGHPWYSDMIDNSRTADSMNLAGAAASVDPAKFRRDEIRIVPAEDAKITGPSNRLDSSLFDDVADAPKRVTSGLRDVAGYVL